MEYDGTATRALKRRPLCDLCPLSDIVPRPAAVDGKTRMGPWAYMCVPCFDAHGIGLGWGRGQRLLIEPTEERA